MVSRLLLFHLVAALPVSHCFIRHTSLGRPPQSRPKLLQATSLKGSVYIATTVDGYIAEPDGGVKFLDAFMESTDEGDMGFADFLGSVDVIVMGKKSFQKVISFGMEMWAYGETPVVIWSRSDELKIPEALKRTVSCSNKSPTDLFQELEQQGKRHAYVDGGFTVQSFLKHGLIDQLILTRVPLILGDGIPLFSTSERQIQLIHEKTESFSNGLVQSKYRVSKERKSSQL